jgi:hypothetical protein
MAKKKKTLGVAQVLDYANLQLKRTDSDATKDFKSGVCTMIERVLHDTGNYNGFMFINPDDSDHGTLGYFSRKYFS